MKTTQHSKLDQPFVPPKAQPRDTKPRTYHGNPPPPQRLRTIAGRFYGRPRS